MSAPTADGIGAPAPWFRDSAFIDTPGRSNALMPDGRIVYLRGVAPTTGAYLRVIPRFADRVAAAITTAERPRR